jgi:NTP pyrophosphatase (non-canonical NTP hydrolase)
MKILILCVYWCCYQFTDIGRKYFDMIIEPGRCNDKISIFEQIIKEVINFRDERNWKQFHNPKDLAISLSLEAGELLENFQWKTSEEAVAENLENIKDEIADVVIYTMLLLNELDINLEQVIKEKIQKNKKKYPVDKAFGSRKKYTEY